MVDRRKLERAADELLKKSMIDPVTVRSFEEERRRQQDISQRNAYRRQRQARRRQQADNERRRFEAEMEVYESMKPEEK